MSAMIQYYGTGRRKEAVARVFVRPGTGTVRVNDRAFDDYFPQATLRMMIEKPLALTETREKLDVIANIAGGGPTGQAGAMRLGIARALLEFDASLRPKLKVEGLLTRDAREVERKKYGRPGARKRFQFSKR
ncbi:MAG: 30S ribosomal protein S9 [Acidobacteria bacterium]|jgi:small subunit ribosomal protein S9|nr:30S ribosomal protein S9 [Acidobacteriota bacterium]MCU0254387.1 30S ribosomal protein S9 [Acidobacteriota bacterium]